MYDVSKGGDIEYIVMELIDGITLKQYMEKWAAKLVELAALHYTDHAGPQPRPQPGIVHRDIKPQNVGAAGRR